VSDSLNVLNVQLALVFLVPALYLTHYALIAYKIDYKLLVWQDGLYLLV